MAITVTSCQSKRGFIRNAISADASGGETIIAAPGAGVRIAITHLTLASNSAISLTIGQGLTGGAVTSALLGPLPFAVNTAIQWNFSPPLYLDANTALTIDASGAGNICAFVQGFIE